MISSVVNLINLDVVFQRMNDLIEQILSFLSKLFTRTIVSDDNNVYIYII